MVTGVFIFLVMWVSASLLLGAAWSALYKRYGWNDAP